MKKTLALLLVASLLLAGCTELISSDDDDEVKKIEVNEEIAIEKINDFITVDEDESFGITMMYDMDPAMMGMSDMLEVEEDSDAIITIEMSQAWSPDGYHTSEISGISNGDSSMKFVSTMTHIGTTMYFEIGYEITGNICAEEDDAVKQINSTMEEKYGEDWQELATEDELEEAFEAYSEAASCERTEEMMEAQPVSSYSMTTTTTHTQVIAAMAEETEDNSDDMDPMEMLMFFSFVECMGKFTPAESVDGLQVYDVSMEGMDEDSMTPELALCMFDTDDNNGVSFEEIQNAGDSGEEVDDDELEGMQSAFDEADSDGDGELTGDELDTFIAMMNDDGNNGHGNDDDGHDDSNPGNSHDDDGMGDDSDSEMMPNMAVAFNDQGEIEYFEMEMEGTLVKMYVLTEDRVNSFFTDVDAGESVALPFTVSDSMDDGSDDWDDNGGSGEYIDAYLTDNWASSENDYAEPELRVYSGFDDIAGVYLTLYDDNTPVTSWDVSTSMFVDMSGTGMGMVYYVPLENIDYGEGCYMLTATITDMDGYSWQWSREDICFYGEDDDDHDGHDHDDDHDGHDHGDDEEVWTFYREFAECDTDGNMLINYDELQACVEMDLANDGSDMDADDIGLQDMFNFADDDDDANLSEDEFEFIYLVLSGLSDDDYDDHDDHHDEEFTCDDGETIPMYLVNDGEEDCVGGEDEGYVWTYNYDNCAVSDDGLSSLDCWTNEMDVDGDGTPEDSDSYWNYECEQLADGTWECGTDHINYYDQCEPDAHPSYVECWLDEWDTDNDGDFDLGSDGYEEGECELLDDGRWACSHSDVIEVFQNYHNCSEENGMYECWNDDWVDSDGNVAVTDGYELADCSQLEDGTWDCFTGYEFDDDHDDWPTFICGDGTEIPFDHVNDGGADCTDGADEQQYDSDGNEINWFDCMDGSQVWISQVNDGTEDCPDGDDEMPDMDDDHHDDDAPSPQELLELTDTDSSGTMTMDEFNAYMGQDGEEIPQEMIDEFNLIFDEADSDDSGDLDIDELEQFIMEIDSYMMSMEDSEEMFTCDNGETIPLDYVDDGYEDCSDGSDEPEMDDDHGHDDGHDDDSDGHDGHDHDDHDHGDHGDGSDEERVWYITNEMDFHFEGDMSDYWIEFATCEEETDYETGETTKNCWKYSQIPVSDAASEGGANGVMYHDADNSGTISEGDMIHVTDEMKMQYDVRLYSVSADAYSDENPMHDAPGFTGLVGMLALLGAAFIRRNE
ncbi:MAG: hypothetical protein QGF34_00305 [Candidatus Poseidoniaceae archaeon]|nr:hypothetical protein [Candidatus Poseidoniaceae archaeon]